MRRIPGTTTGHFILAASIGYFHFTLCGLRFSLRVYTLSDKMAQVHFEQFSIVFYLYGPIPCFFKTSAWPRRTRLGQSGWVLRGRWLSKSSSTSYCLCLCVGLATGGSHIWPWHRSWLRP